MKTNMGSVDRLLRIGAAIILAALFFSGTVTGTLGVVFMVVTAILLLTGMLGHCPLYDPFRITTVHRRLIH